MKRRSLRCDIEALSVWHPHFYVEPPARSLVEFAAVAMALVLVHKVVPLGTLNVMQYGDRADYRSMVSRRVLEVSGTETFGDLKRRHREKMAQALANPLRWDALVVVCAFCSEGHRVIMSQHAWEERPHA